MSMSVLGGRGYYTIEGQFGNKYLSCEKSVELNPL